MEMKSPLAGHAGLILATGGAILFAMKSILAKLAYAEGASVEQILALRMAFSFPVFAFVGVRLAVKTGARVKARHYAAASLLGVISYYICSLLDFAGLQFISAQLERLILFLYPTITAVLAAIFLKEHITVRHAIAIVLSYAGVAILFGSEAVISGHEAAKGSMLVFGAAVLFAIYLTASKPFIARLSAPLFTSVAMSAASVAMIMHFLVVATTKGAPPMTAPIALYGLALAIFSTILPSFMLSEAVARIGPGYSAAVTGIGPAATAAFAVIILGEPFGAPQAAALALTVGGVLALAGGKKT